jgi:hypothetical protein
MMVIWADMLRTLSVLFFILLFFTGSFSKNLQASNLVGHLLEEHSHDKGPTDEKKDHHFELSFLVQVVSVEKRMEVMPGPRLCKEISSFPFFVSQIHLSNFISSLFRPPIA